MGVGSPGSSRVMDSPCLCAEPRLTGRKNQGLPWWPGPLSQLPLCSPIPSLPATLTGLPALLDLPRPAASLSAKHFLTPTFPSELNFQAVPSPPPSPLLLSVSEELS